MTDRSPSPCERSCAAADDRPTHDPAVPQPESVARRSRVGSLGDAVAAQIGCGLLATSLSVRVHRILYMSHASVESNSAAHGLIQLARYHLSSDEQPEPLLGSRHEPRQAALWRPRRNSLPGRSGLASRAPNVCALCRSTKQAVEPAPAAGYGFQAPPGALSQARPLALCCCISSDGVSMRIEKSQLELELNLKSSWSFPSH